MYINLHKIVMFINNQLKKYLFGKNLNL